MIRSGQRHLILGVIGFGARTMPTVSRVIFSGCVRLSGCEANHVAGGSAVIGWALVRMDGRQRLCDIRLLWVDVGCHGFGG